MIKVIYQKDDSVLVIVRDRYQLVKFVTMLVKEYPIELRNMLPQYSIEQNCNYHPVRILHEYGCDCINTLYKF